MIKPEMNFSEKVAELAGHVTSTLISGIAGGYIYAKCAGLPAKQVAIAFTIWAIAERSLLGLVQLCFENKSAASILGRSIIMMASTYVGITELLKRNLIGPKLIGVILILNCIAFFKFNADIKKFSTSDSAKTDLDHSAGKTSSFDEIPVVPIIED